MSSYLRRALRWSCSAAVLAAFAGCADSSLGPTPSAKRATLESTVADTTAPDTVVRYNLLQRTSTLDRVYWVTGWIYPNQKDYQSLKIRQAGLSVSFPPGAVTAPVYVTLVAHPGRFVSYEFFPHGVTFNVPVKIQQDLHGTTAFKNATVMSNLQGGYLARGWYDIDHRTGTAPLAERFPIVYWDGTEEFTKTTPAVAKFYTTHFSGYTLVSGVRGNMSIFEE